MDAVQWTDAEMTDMFMILDDLCLFTEGRTLSEERKNAWMRILLAEAAAKQITAKQMLRALNLALRTYEEHRMPLPGHILGMVLNRP